MTFLQRACAAALTFVVVDELIRTAMGISGRGEPSGFLMFTLLLNCICVWAPWRGWR